jgi:hypothetical protein
MGAVYRACRADGQFHQTAALKIMAGYQANPEFLRRFETERQFLALIGVALSMPRNLSRSSHVFLDLLGTQMPYRLPRQYVRDL